MFRYFKYMTLLLFVLGMVFFIGSVIMHFSFWYGIYMMKGSMYLLLIGTILYLMEHEFSRKMNKRSESFGTEK